MKCQKHVKMLLLLFCTAFCVSCAENIAENNDKDGLDESYQISVDSAIAISDYAIQAVSEQKHTRGLKTRSINDVELVDLSSKNKTRTNNEEEISAQLYLINYKDNKGFAVIASDKRLRTLYAVSDTGNISINDTVKNKNLTLFFNGVKNDIALQSERHPTLDTSQGREIVVAPQISPMIWVAPSLWGQDEPYNTYCYTKEGKKAKVGCAAVACGMIMSYYAWPVYIDGQRLKWHSMKKYTVDHKIDYIFGKLGEEKQLDIQYGEKSSGARISNIPRTFERMGYDEPDGFHEFSESDACRLLEDKKREDYGPLLIVGREVNDIGGHAWVIDGYCKDVTNVAGTEVLYNTVLFHCVWGWDGLNNGYFYLNDGKLGGPASIFNQEDKGFASSSAYVFKNLSYMSNFKINRNKEKVNLQ